MDFEEFSSIVQHAPRAVVLLEGMRDLPESDRQKLVTMGRLLAKRFPHARFRTGNASGTDEAFARGVADVAAARLEYILPYAGHRKKKLAAGARCISLQDVPEVVADAVDCSLKSSPNYTSLMEKRAVVPRLRAKADYIIRDTVKVIGAPEHHFFPATIGLFYASPDDPMQGGTGHTIRVCRQHNVPDVLQDIWLDWIPELDKN